MLTIEDGKTTVLGIDQSLKSTGFALWKDGKTQSGTVSFQKAKDDPFLPRMHAEFWKWITRALITEKPQLVVYEFPVSQGQGANAIPLMGLRTLIETACALRGIECIGVWPSSLKLFATGSGKAEKAQMQEAARREFSHYRPENDPGCDEGDALCLLLYGLKRPDLELKVEKPKPKRRKKPTP